MTELLICIKYGKGEFPAPHPPHVVLFWTVLLSIVGSWAVWRFGLKPYWTAFRRSSSRSGNKKTDGEFSGTETETEAEGETEEEGGLSEEDATIPRRGARRRFP